jgi:hypothetical protein
MENKKDEKGKMDECCGGHRCCAGKAALVLVLLLIGGIAGFCVGRGCGHKGFCPVSGGSMEAPTK